MSIKRRDVNVQKRKELKCQRNLLFYSENRAKYSTPMDKDLAITQAGSYAIWFLCKLL